MAEAAVVSQALPRGLLAPLQPVPPALPSSADLSSSEHTSGGRKRRAASSCAKAGLFLPARNAKAIEQLLCSDVLLHYLLQQCAFPGSPVGGAISARIFDGDNYNEMEEEEERQLDFDLDPSAFLKIEDF